MAKRILTNINENAQSAKSQCDMIIAWLKKGYSITQSDAQHRFGCFRLESRIQDLRQRGYNIITRRFATTKGKHVCVYVLDE